jgi:uncharacterized membrane protein
MSKERLLGFSDGVIAVIITIMVLELEAPEGAAWSDLRPQMPIFLSYVLSFLLVAIYWVNHHHMFQAVKDIHGGILWANITLLFWMSLTPFLTAWMGATHFASIPVASYGMLQLLLAISYTVLAQALVRHHGAESNFARALGDDIKGRMSLAFYLASVPLAFLQPRISVAIFVTVGLMWLVPDQRFERALRRGSRRHG